MQWLLSQETGRRFNQEACSYTLAFLLPQSFKGCSLRAGRLPITREQRAAIGCDGGGAVLPPRACSSGRQVTQAPRCEAQLLHHISNTLVHKYLLTKFLWASSVHAAGATSPQEGHSGGYVVHPAQPCDPPLPATLRLFLFCLPRNGFEKTCFTFVTDLHTHSAYPARLSPGVSSQAGVLGVNGEWRGDPPAKDRDNPHGDRRLQSGESVWGGRLQQGYLNIKHYEKKNKLSFSQEHLQTFLYQGKAPKPARSAFTERASLRTAKPAGQSKRVPTPLTWVSESSRCWLHPCKPSPRFPVSSAYYTRPPAGQTLWAQHSHSTGTYGQEPRWSTILLQGCT